MSVGVTFKHDLRELVLDAPSGRARDAEMTLEHEGGDGVFLLMQHVESRSGPRIASQDPRRRNRRLAQ